MGKLITSAKSLISRSPTWALVGIPVIVAGVIIVGIGSSGSYPIAVVNGQAVSAHTFDTNYKAALFYYETMNRMTPPGSTSSVNIDPKAVGAAVLDQLITASLIEAAARSEIGADLDSLVSEKLASYEQDAELASNIKRFYNVDYATFRSEALVPQAKADLLGGRLFARGEKIGDWVIGAKRSAKVTILSGSFRWDGEKVVVQ